MMNISDLQTYEDLEAFLRDWRNAGGDPVPYDFNGAFHLLLAIVDSLRQHGLETELADYVESMTDEQAAYIRFVLEERERNTEQET